MQRLRENSPGEFGGGFQVFLFFYPVFFSVHLPVIKPPSRGRRKSDWYVVGKDTLPPGRPVAAVRRKNSLQGPCHKKKTGRRGKSACLVSAYLMSVSQDLDSSFLMSEEQIPGVLLRRTTDFPCSSHHLTHSSNLPPRWSSPRARISKSIFSSAATPTVW